MKITIGFKSRSHLRGWLGSTTEGRRPQVRGFRAGGSLDVASSTLSQNDSFKNFRKPDREYNPVFLDALRDWAAKVVRE
jgi:hypothetical protein